VKFSIVVVFELSSTLGFRLLWWNQNKGEIKYGLDKGEKEQVRWKIEGGKQTR